MAIKSKLIKEIVDLGLEELRKDTTQSLIATSILDPLIGYIVDKLKPYIIASVTAIIILFILLIALIYVVLTSPL